ncbi:MAG: indole-3-glycerol phosphate synthase TrpC [Syntrophales bacterium]
MTILDKIITAKKREVALLKKSMPLPELQARVKDVPVATGPDFRVALGGSCAIIAEIKRHSPSCGALREEIDPGEAAAVYEQNGAAAISVLTEREFFHGASADLVAIKQRVGIPVLRKDFIIDAYQIYESRLIGADAMLLIAGVLPETRLREFIAIARSLGIWPLVEVHAINDLEVALAAGAEIIGVNNRNLQTFITDISNSLVLAAHVPAGKILVSESGIRNRIDIEMLMEAGIHAFLIGETLMRAAEPGQQLRELSGRRVTP